LIDDVCTAATASESEINHSNRTRKLVKSKLFDITHQNIMVVDTIDNMLLASIALLEAMDLHEEVRWNFDIGLHK